MSTPVPGGSGGGVALSLPADVQQPTQGCGGEVTYWVYTHDATVTISYSNFTNNTALANATNLSAPASGGGLYLTSGGALAVAASVFANNSAQLFGGGLAMGGGGAAATCALQVQGGSFSGNAAGHGGSQLYSTCSADLGVAGTLFQLNTEGAQVGRGAVCTCDPPLRLRPLVRVGCPAHACAGCSVA
jgi:hypothetical protein